MLRRGGWALLTAGALTVGGVGTAGAGRLDFAAELRADVNLSFGSRGQYGTGDSTGPCQPNPDSDGGGSLSASLAAVASSARYRHQLTASVGYYALYCTPLLRRAVGGFDYRGEHQLSERTRLQGAAHYTFDVFDRSFAALSGTTLPSMTPDQAMPVPGAASAGLPYLLGQASLDLTHAFSRLYGLRAGVQLSSLEVLGALNQLPYYSTLGPMESGALHVNVARDGSRSRFELGLRYRVSGFYSTTWLNIRKRAQLPAAQDVQLAPVWERKLSPTLTLHVELGAALAHQPHLCAQVDSLLIASDRCSIDARAPGIRGYDGAAPLEAHLGRRTTLAPVGTLTFSYTAPRRRLELNFVRTYDPDAYAGSLSLVDRLSANLYWRPIWDLLLHGSVQLLHSSETSPARVDLPTAGLLLQPLSPQNRTLFMTMGSLGADYHVAGPLALYLNTTFQALKIRGEEVPEVPSQSQSLATRVQMTPSVTTVGVDPARYQDIYRLSLIFGVRLQFDTLPSARREPDVFTEARGVP